MARLHMPVLARLSIALRGREVRETDAERQRHVRLGAFPSAPWPQRLSAQDTRTYRQPLFQSHDNYLTFWQGNQLPGMFMHTAPTAYIPYSSQEDLRPRLAGGSFGPVMTQLQTAQLVADWRAAWNSLVSRY